MCRELGRMSPHSFLISMEPHKGSFGKSMTHRTHSGSPLSTDSQPPKFASGHQMGPDFGSLGPFFMDLLPPVNLVSLQRSPRTYHIEDAFCTSMAQEKYSESHVVI